MRNERGITLIEIIIGFALLSTTMVIGVSSYASISKLQQNGATVRAVQQGGRYALEAITRDIRSAGGLTLNSAQCLSILSADPDQNTITYSFYSEKLYRSETTAGTLPDCNGAGSVVTIGNSRVTALTFTLPDTSTVQKAFVVVDMDVAQLDATLTDVTDQNKYAYHLNTIVTPRGF